MLRPVLLIWASTVLASIALGGTPAGLPLGDGAISSTPEAGKIMTCQSWFLPWAGGAHRQGGWVRDGFWFPAEKPIVAGDVAWPDAKMTIAVEGDARVVRSNLLPSHRTGVYPIQAGSAAFAYDLNPNSIRAGAIVWRLPVSPTLTARPSCLGMGPVGYLISGAAIFHGLDAAGRDAPAHEIQDRCNGHPEVSGQYHYHNWTPCLAEGEVSPDGHSGLAGWMRDGFPIFGPKGESGKTLTNADLDACHGHRHAVLIDGAERVTYHYHFTKEYPYSIGCYRGTPIRDAR